MTQQTSRAHWQRWWWIGLDIRSLAVRECLIVNLPSRRVLALLQYIIHGCIICTEYWICMFKICISVVVTVLYFSTYQNPPTLFSKSILPACHLWPCLHDTRSTKSAPIYWSAWQLGETKHRSRDQGLVSSVNPYIIHIFISCSWLVLKVWFWKFTWNPKNGGLEDDDPFQLGDFLGSMSMFRGVNECKWWLGGGFKYALVLPRIPGEMIQFDEHIFQMGWNHQPDEIDVTGF